MNNEPRTVDVETVANLIDSLIRDAEVIGVAPGVLQELRRYLDHACDRVEHLRRGWQ